MGNMGAKPRTFFACTGECVKNLLLEKDLDFEPQNSARTKCDYTGRCGRIYQVTEAQPPVAQA